MKKAIKTILLGILAAIIVILAVFAFQANFAKAEQGWTFGNFWKQVNTTLYTQVSSWVLSINQYLNFNQTSGDSGFGLRNNSGTIQLKNQGGSWQNLVSGSIGAASIDLTQNSILYGNALNKGAELAGGSSYNVLHINSSGVPAWTNSLGVAGSPLGTSYFSQLGDASNRVGTIYATTFDGDYLNINKGVSDYGIDLNITESPTTTDQYVRFNGYEIDPVIKFDATNLNFNFNYPLAISESATTTLSHYVGGDLTVDGELKSEFLTNNYVPYSGANNNLDLGSNALNFGVINGIQPSGVGNTLLFGGAAIFNFSGLNGQKTVMFPDKDGTVAYLDDIPAPTWTTVVNDIYYNTGNVGIGTTVPLGLLHIINPTTELFYVSASTTSPSVGIGTTNPVVNLEVRTTQKGEGVVSGSIFVGNWNSDATYAVMAHKNFRQTNAASGYAFIQSQAGQTYFNSQTGQPLNFSIAGARRMVLSKNGGLSLGNAFIDFAAPADALLVSGKVGIGTTNPIGALSVMNGNVGVGTTNPTALLEIATTTTDWAAGVRPLMRVATKTTEALFVGANGRVGVGTTNPIADVQIISDGSELIKFMVASSTASSIANPPLMVDSAGNVGIGVTAADARLSINGSMKVGNGQQIIFPGSAGATGSLRSAGVNDLTFRFSGTDRATMLASGNFGIGTTNPLAQLHASSTTEQLRITNGQTDIANYASFTVSNTGQLTVNLNATSATTTFSDSLATDGSFRATGSIYTGDLVFKNGWRITEAVKYNGLELYDNENRLIAAVDENGVMASIDSAQKGDTSFGWLGLLGLLGFFIKKKK